VIVTFADAGSEDLFHGRDSKAARRICPQSLWRVARRKLDQLNAAITLDSLRVPPGNRLEVLKGGRAGEHRIRINDQFRICFTWTEAGPTHVAIVDYH
jgi:proteic killer suppression protein